MKISRQRLFSWGFCFWILMLCLSQLVYSSWEARESAGGRAAQMQLLGVAAFITLSLPMFMRGMSRLERHLRRPDYLLFSVFCVFCFASTLWAEDATAAAVNALFLMYTFITFYEANGLSPASRITVVTTVIMVVGAYFIALLIYGVGNGRTIGAIQPNQLAKIAIGLHVLVLFAIGGSLISTVSFALTLLVCILVSSRGGIAYLLLLSVVVVDKAKWKRVAVPLLRYSAPIAVVLLLALIAYGAWDMAAPADTLAHHLGIHDDARGLNSGLSGRLEHWEAGGQEVLKKPFFGAGFKNSADVVLAHSGFLNILLDVGLIGGLMFLAAFCTLMMLNVARLSRELGYHYEGFNVEKISLACKVMFIAIALIDPLYINFGFPLTVILLLMMFVRRETYA